MKKIVMYGLILLVNILTACGNKDVISNEEATILNISTNEEENIMDIANSEEVSKVQEDNKNLDETDEYVSVYPIIVTNNRALTLNVFGKMISEEFEQYGISEIEVLDGDEVIQRIKISEAIIAEWGEDSFDGYTQSYFQDGGIILEDMNFDGATDIGLIGWTPATSNIPYYYWLWDEKNEQFSYSFCLNNPEVDLENRYVISSYRVGGDTYETDYYNYDDANHLIIVKKIVERIDENGIITEEVYELRNGLLQKVE